MCLCAFFRFCLFICIFYPILFCFAIFFDSFLSRSRVITLDLGAYVFVCVGVRELLFSENERDTTETQTDVMFIESHDERRPINNSIKCLRQDFILPTKST